MYATSIIENDWMFITRIPRRANPRRTSFGAMREASSTGAGHAAGGIPSVAPGAVMRGRSRGRSRLEAFAARPRAPERRDRGPQQQQQGQNHGIDGGLADVGFDLPPEVDDGSDRARIDQAVQPLPPLPAQPAHGP